VVVVVVVAAATVRVSGALETRRPALSVTVSTTFATPALVGVPLMRPALEIERPPGRPFADQV
jgi:hypothetical protein